MNRGERRYKTSVKNIQKLKRYWNRYGTSRIYDRDNHIWVYVKNVNDAIKLCNETNGRLFGWLNNIKDGGLHSRRNKGSWNDYEHKRNKHKEKINAKKQLKVDTENALALLDPYEWEHHCGACDNFPGDDFNEPSPFIFHECPHKGKINADTCWKDFNCPYFWD